MKRFLLTPAAKRQLFEIEAYTAAQWGDDQAERYVRGMFEHAQAVTEGRAAVRNLDRSLQLKGFRSHYERHNLYWRRLSEDEVELVAILHQRMEQRAGLAEALEI